MFAGRLRLLSVVPRSRWLSLAGGVSVAYVFVHLLPELAEAQESVAEVAARAVPVDRHVYVLSLAGLALFYGLECLTADSRGGRPGSKAGAGAFWLSIGSVAVYNGIVGYLLVARPQPGLRELILFTFALAVHFVANDFGLRQRHRDDYACLGRWLLAVAVLGGWAIALVVEPPEAAPDMLLAVLAGGVVLNTMKEELPEERREPASGPSPRVPPPTQLCCWSRSRRERATPSLSGPPWRL